MAQEDIIQNMILQLGQSQPERLAAELRPEHAPVDDRTEIDLLRSAQAFAGHVAFHSAADGSVSGDWRPFFPESLTATGDVPEANGRLTPHLALYLAFLRLYRQPQALLNRLTRSHLDFYYGEVLRLARRPAQPDRAHVIVELKKQAAPVAVSTAHEFLAGKDAAGRELVYRPTAETVVNTARVASLRSLFVDRRGHGLVRYAPVADSADGLGTALPATAPKWRGFGHPDLPAAEVGFALASPVLRMKEGTRTVSVELRLSGLTSAEASTTALRGAFQAYITGEKNWLGPYALSPTLDTAGVMRFEFTVPATEKAVIDYRADIHGYAYTAQAPVVQVLLDPAASGIGYTALSRATVLRATVAVDVTGITSLGLESDTGTLDPKKAFQPFGPEPRRGSRFLVAYDEALAKRLTKLELAVRWKGAPTDFGSHYTGIAAVTNTSFQADVSYGDAAGRHDRTVALFASAQTEENTFELAGTAPFVASAPSSGYLIHALAHSGGLWATTAMRSFVLRSPVLAAYQTSAPAPVQGYISFSLRRDFGHETYRRNYVTNLMTYSRDGGTLTVLRDPYTPVIQAITLGYRATTGEIDFTEATAASFASPDLHFFHITYFGQTREHAYQRAQFPFLAGTSVPLVHRHEHEGELLIGLQHLAPRDSVSLLFHLAEGSADPDLTSRDVAWSVLCDNTWKALGPEHVTRDTTNHFLASGVIQFVIPAEATTSNTILPAGMIWLRGGLAREVNAVAQVIAVKAGAVEVALANREPDLAHLATALPAGTITRLRTPLAAVKSVAQPFASFGGAPTETPSAFQRRVAERLRHKARCITPWDYERIVLEAFPKVHRVKCIRTRGPAPGSPPAMSCSWSCPTSAIRTPSIPSPRGSTPTRSPASRPACRIAQPGRSRSTSPTRRTSASASPSG